MNVQGCIFDVEGCNKDVVNVGKCGCVKNG